ncbi:hypothetical protein LINPERPRIM_LOCUS4948 [Linum perenne]
MWEQNARKLMADVEKLQEDTSDRLIQQARLEKEFSESGETTPTPLSGVRTAVDAGNRTIIGNRRASFGKVRPAVLGTPEYRHQWINQILQPKIIGRPSVFFAAEVEPLKLKNQNNPEGVSIEQRRKVEEFHDLVEDELVLFSDVELTEREFHTPSPMICRRKRVAEERVDDLPEEGED